MKTSKIGVVALLASAMLAGCNGGNSSSSITLTIWEDESNLEVVQTLADEWVANYRNAYPFAPKITVNVEEQSEKSAIEKMQTQAITGYGPDIAAVTHDTIASGVQGQLLAKASFYNDVKERMTLDAVNAVTFEGEVYGYPITAESVTLMYNKDLIDDPSKLASFESIKENNIKIGLQVRGDDGGFYTWGMYTDSVLFGADGKHDSEVDIATEKSVHNAYTFYSEYKEVIYDYTPETNANYLRLGEIAGVITSPFLFTTVKNILGDKLGIVKLPSINGEKQLPFSGYKAYVVSAYSENGALAQDLANYITSYDAQTYRLVEKGYLPACHLDATEDLREAVALDPFASIFAASLEDSRVMPNIPKMSNFWGPMNRAATSFMNAESLTEEYVREQLQSVTNELKK